MNRHNHEGYLDPTAYGALMRIEHAARAAQWREILARVSGYRPLTYICAPNEEGANAINTQKYCGYAAEQGRIPVAPHLLFTQFLNAEDEEQHALGLFMGRVLMTKCAEVWVFGDEITAVMAMEIEKAENRGMPVRYFTTGCEEVGASGGGM